MLQSDFHSSIISKIGKRKFQKTIMIKPNTVVKLSENSHQNINIYCLQLVIVLLQNKKFE